MGRLSSGVWMRAVCMPTVSGGIVKLGEADSGSPALIERPGSGDKPRTVCHRFSRLAKVLRNFSTFGATTNAQ